MKALEILKEHKYSLECLLRTDVVSHLLKQTNEAIVELEELENRSCERCKYSFDIFTGLDDSFLGEDFICTKLEVDKVFEKDFYCSKYEPKQ